MIPSVPSSYEDELFGSAYANISLIGDKTWAFDSQDTFHKLNQSLWIQNCKVNEEIKRANESYRRRRVRDVIPYSRLARYGDYEYNEEREKLYRPDGEETTAPLPRFCWTEVTEPWMLPEVERHFARMLAPRPNYELPRTNEWDPESAVLRNVHQESGQRMSEKRNEPGYEAARNPEEEASEKSDVESYDHQRYSIENMAEMQLHIRIGCNSVRDLWNPTQPSRQQSYNQNANRLQCYQRYTNRRSGQSYTERTGQQFYCTVQYQPFILRAEYQAAPIDNYAAVRKQQPLPPALCPEVPEFFPKPARFQTAKDFTGGNRVQYFPSINERTYQNELFPYRAHENPVTVYQNTGVSILPGPEATGFLPHPQHWFQRIPPPQMQITTSGTAPMCSIQPGLRPPVNHRPLQVQEKFVPGVQTTATPIPVYQRPLELYNESGPKRKSQGVDFKNLILLTKSSTKTHRGQSKNRQEKSGDSKTSRTSRTDRGVLQWLDKNYTKSNEPGRTENSEQREFEEEGNRNRRTNSWEELATRSERLKFESNIVVKNSNVAGNEEAEGGSKKRLYRDVLTNHGPNQPQLENVFEKRYDELEQQAMEQYRLSEESLALKYQELERQAMEQYTCTSSTRGDSSSQEPGGGQGGESSQGTEYCTDGQRCPGFGRCSPVKRQDSANKEPMMILAKPESKSGTDVSSRALCENLRSTVSKSLTALTQQVACSETKCLSKSATDRKASRTVRGPAKKRLVLVTPFEGRTETRLLRRTDLERICQVTKTRRNIFSYRDGQNGSGDDNLAIVQSPKTEVWLSGFWTT